MYVCGSAKGEKGVAGYEAAGKCVGMYGWMMGVCLYGCEWV